MTLLAYSDNFKANFDRFRNSFPDTFLAAEELADVLGSLSRRYQVPEEAQLWQEVVRAMLFGCSSSWSLSFIATSSGLDEVGLTSIRRSIEFTCYIAKIVRSKDREKRAKLWKDQRESDEVKKAFAGEFSVPRAYLSEKYSDLHQLLVTYEHASDFAIHANLSMLATKASDSETKLELSVFDDPQDTPVSAGNILQFGNWMTASLLADLKEWIMEYEQLKSCFGIFHEAESKAKSEIGRFYGQEYISSSIRSAMFPHGSYLDLELEKLKRKYTGVHPPSVT